jgi:hypothetical protein
MLIKIQHHRMSRDWTIIEDARNVKYSAHPVGFGTLKEYEEFERDFFAKHNSGNALVFKDSHGKVVWNPSSTYFINELSFLNDQGSLENVIFDGEAYICNNDGKTVQKIHRGGFVSNIPPSEAIPLPEAA